MIKIVFLCSLFVTSPAFSATNSIIIRSVSIIDGTGADKIGPIDLEIVGNKIARIGPNLKSSASETIDGSGKTLIPGLIDTHTHLHSVPGSVFRKESSQEIRRQQLLQMKAYLAAGVTTVLDTAAPESLFKEIADGKEVAPRILGLAPFLTPKGGYFSSPEARGDIYSDLWSPINDTKTIADHFTRAASLNPLGTKVTLEKGFGPFEVWPVFDSAFRSTIVSEAKKHSSRLFIHSMSKEEHRIALSMHPYTLVHAGFNDKVADAEIIQEIKSSGAYVSTTLAIYKMMLLMWQPNLMEDPWLRKLVPTEQLKTASDSETTKKVIETVVGYSKPRWTPIFIAKLFSRILLSKSIIEDQLTNSMKSVKMMQDAGIPLVMGSDAGNWPVWSTFFHGVGSILEIEALRDAGLSVNEVIVASTFRGAKMLKIENQVGHIAEGMIADIVILNEDPLTSPTAFRNVEMVIKDGVARTPEEWLK